MSSPLLFQSLDDGVTLKRVEFDSPAFREADLQELLRRHPEALPIGELEPGFAPVVCIGREVRTDSGTLDNMYISQTGNITLVETKLWKNPEARREVVGQIIDYTKQIAGWSYAQLDDAARKYLVKYENSNASLYDWLSEKEKFDDLPAEPEFVDQVTANLNSGRFLVLIVGDGIRRGVEEMVTFIQDTPHLHFHLALVEMACHRLPDKQWPLIVVPRIVADTTKIERAVVRIEMSRETARQVTATVTVAPESVTGRRRGGRQSITEEQFFEQLDQKVGHALAEKTRQFTQRLANEIDGITLDPRTWLHVLWEPTSDEFDDPVKLMTISGERGTLWAAPGHMRKRLPQSNVDAYLNDFYGPWPDQAKVAIERGKGGPNVSIEQASEHFDQLFEAVCRLVAAVENT